MAALASAVVVVSIASRVATSTPSKVELVVIGPVIAPPARGKAASPDAALEAAAAALSDALLSEVAAFPADVLASPALVEAVPADVLASLALVVAIVT
tara:strand:- start:76 stop:369 length:294 start_codon:yes stop_codon:yes gene_type:complete